MSALAAMLFICTFHAPAAHAATIACVDTWNDVEERFDDNTLKQSFPSGRKPTPTTCRTIFMYGHIVASDEAYFLKVLQTYHPFLTTVIIASPGGDFNAAIVIGEMVRKYHLITVAPSLPQHIAENFGRIEVFPGGFVSDGQNISIGLRSGSEKKMICQGFGCFCASSCTNIWAAGSLRFGNFLGVHEVYTKQVQSQQGSAPGVLLKPQAGAIAFNQQYLGDMEVPQELIQKSASTSPYGISWASSDDMRQMIYPASTLKLLDTCSSDMNPIACYLVKLANLRDAMDPPTNQDLYPSQLQQLWKSEQSSQ